LIIFDEADEIFLQPSNHDKIGILINKLKSYPNLVTQFLLFSATFTDEVMGKINTFIPPYKAYLMKKEFLTLKGVQQFKMILEPKK
jgi:superfamily II DNA/RNA helicase